MSRHNYGRSPRPWSKLKSRVEALFDPRLELAIHCTVFCYETKAFLYDEPRHWVVLGRGGARRTVWDFPVPFMGPSPARGRPIQYYEDAYPYPSLPSVLLRAYLDRPRHRLMEGFDDPWELTDVLRAADRRLGRATVTAWAATLDAGHPARPVLEARFGDGRQGS